MDLLERLAQELTGETPEALRDMSIDERQRRKGAKLSVVQTFPFVGRGNVLADRILDEDEVNRLLDIALQQ